ncbi:hypothetical protein, partial [Ruminococcus sp.]|uniref:hypothetical protein n=1 Tax=Ruminococcus sp. TaxID=41978 RepID=UPI003FD87EA9
NKAVSEQKPLHRFFNPPAQRKIRKERSDFAARRTFPNHRRGEHRSPVLRICCVFRIVGDGVLDVPFGEGTP